MDINFSKRDIAWNYMGTMFSMGINYLMLPFFLAFFDDDTLGIWYIFMNIATIANLFTFGFSQSFARNIAYCWGGAKELKGKGKVVNINDLQIDKINVELFFTILKTCKRIYMLIAVVASMFLGSVGTIYILVIVSFQNKGTAIAWGIFLCAIFLNLYYGYCEAFLNGVGAIEKKNKSQVIANLTRIALTAILLGMGGGIVGACVAYLCYGLIFRVIGLHFFVDILKRNNLPKTNKKSFTNSSIREVLKKIWPNTWRTGVVTIASYLTSYAGTILISFFVPLSIVGSYSMSVQLVVAVEKIAYSYTGSCHPTLQVNYIKDDWKKLRHNSFKCVMIFCILYVIGIVLLMLLGLPMIKIFRKDYEINKWLVMAIAASEFIIGFRNEFTAILSTMNNVECWKSFLITGIIAVMGGALLMYYGGGIAGIIIATIVSELAYNFWHWPIVFIKELNAMKSECESNNTRIFQ